MSTIDPNDTSHLDTIAAAIAASDGPDEPQPVPAQETPSLGTPAPSEPQPQPEPTQAELSEHAQFFLNHVAEEDRDTVAKYLQPWDAGAQRRFRQYQDELAQYQSYGDPEILEKATFLYNELMTNPTQFRSILDQVMADNGQQPERQSQSQPQPAPRFDDLDPDVVQPMQAVLQAWGNQVGQRFQTYDQQLNAMNRVLQEINSKFTEQESSTAQQREEARLEEELQLLEKQYGPFDRGYVLSQIAAGIDPDEAVQNFGNLRQELLGSLGPQKNLPGPTLSGSGRPPAQPIDYNELSSKQVRELVAQAFQQSGDD